ncbi:uncharacterized protein ARMOST_02166 [Armillaria ostoyae]|uniref:Uncharacterized protein n=1 Tax=Armillaria ostoyae TaxID=47428 RepID=A0A284QR58_ARMOS|nr:uncharacterized protein ARMOST_02166 [Armillaria ostoyae]
MQQWIPTLSTIAVQGGAFTDGKRLVASGTIESSHGAIDKDILLHIKSLKAWACTYKHLKRTDERLDGTGVSGCATLESPSSYLSQTFYPTGQPWQMLDGDAKYDTPTRTNHFHFRLPIRDAFTLAIALWNTMDEDARCGSFQEPALSFDIDLCGSCGFLL